MHSWEEGVLVVNWERIVGGGGGGIDAIFMA